MISRGIQQPAIAVLSILLGVLAGSSCLLPLAGYALPIVAAVNQHFCVLAWGLLLLLYAFSHNEKHWRTSVILALSIGALGNACIALIQFFGPPVEQYPEWLYSWVMPTSTPGRAIGNIGQPNHLAIFIAMGAAAWGGAAASGRIKADGAWVGMALLMWGIILTSSRTGYSVIAFLCTWGLIDKRMSRNCRFLLVSTPLMALAAWQAMDILRDYLSLRFGREDIDSFMNLSTREVIWANTIEMIKAQPWNGVGWGNFNFAWMMTAFDKRPVEIFDHAHNFVLQIIVELGIVVGGAVLIGLTVAFIYAAKQSWSDSTSAGFERRAAIVALLMVGFHSMLEYPLWYPYFLMPTLAAALLALGFQIKPQPDQIRPTGNEQCHPDLGPQTIPAIRLRRWLVVLVGGAMVIGSGLSWWDYQKITPIFSRPTLLAKSMQSRIAVGQSALWYYAYADTAMLRPELFQQNQAWTPAAEHALKSAAHHLLHFRTMAIWAYALHARGLPGDTQKAKYIAARVREFPIPIAQSWFEECKNPSKDSEPLPFQCTPPTEQFTWRDFY